jgi:hypothetical protein
MDDLTDDEVPIYSQLRAKGMDPATAYQAIVAERAPSPTRTMRKPVPGGEPDVGDTTMAERGPTSLGGRFIEHEKVGLRNLQRVGGKIVDTAKAIPGALADVGKGLYEVPMSALGGDLGPYREAMRAASGGGIETYERDPAQMRNLANSGSLGVGGVAFEMLRAGLAGRNLPPTELQQRDAAGPGGQGSAGPRALGTAAFGAGAVAAGGPVLGPAAQAGYESLRRGAGPREAAEDALVGGAVAAPFAALGRLAGGKADTMRSGGSEAAELARKAGQTDVTSEFSRQPMRNVAALEAEGGSTGFTGPSRPTTLGPGDQAAQRVAANTYQRAMEHVEGRRAQNSQRFGAELDNIANATMEPPWIYSDSLVPLRDKLRQIAENREVAGIPIAAEEAKSLTAMFDAALDRGMAIKTETSAGPPASGGPGRAEMAFLSGGDVPSGLSLLELINLKRAATAFARDYSQIQAGAEMAKIARAADDILKREAPAPYRELVDWYRNEMNSIEKIEEGLSQRIDPTDDPKLRDVPTGTSRLLQYGDEARLIQDEHLRAAADEMAKAGDTSLRDALSKIRAERGYRELAGEKMISPYIPATAGGAGLRASVRAPSEGARAARLAYPALRGVERRAGQVGGAAQGSTFDRMRQRAVDDDRKKRENLKKLSPSRSPR